MAWHIHEFQPWLADQLYFRSVEQAIVVLTHKSRVLDGFLSKLPNVRLRADDTHVIRFRMRALIGECNMLTDQHADPNPRHVEAIEERLNVRIDLHSLPVPLVLQDPLSDCRDHAVVPSFDVLECSGETLVVVAQLGRPVVAIVCRGVVAARRCQAFAVAIAIAVALARGVLALSDAGVLSGVTKDLGVLAVSSGRADESFTDFG